MAGESPFASLERESGAVLRSYDGIELPEHYGDPVSEHRAARDAAALFNLGFRARLRFTGSDRATFLHNLLSNDIRSLGAGTGCYATVLTQQSRVVADTNLVCAEEELLLDVEAAAKDRAREHLEKYLVADEVEIDDRESAEATLGIHGLRAAEILREAIGGVEVPGGELEHRLVEIGGAKVRVVRVHWTGASGFDLWLPRSAATAVWGALIRAGQSAGLRPAGMAAFEMLRVEASVPRAALDFDESHLVLEAGLERGI
ncbi:MAG: hypothetical protein ACREQY_09215, partial [Candidatus Binatia bacterium]